MLSWAKVAAARLGKQARWLTQICLETKWLLWLWILWRRQLAYWYLDLLLLDDDWSQELTRKCGEAFKIKIWEVDRLWVLWDWRMHFVGLLNLTAEFDLYFDVIYFKTFMYGIVDMSRIDELYSSFWTPSYPDIWPACKWGMGDDMLGKWFPSTHCMFIASQCYLSKVAMIL